MSRSVLVDALSSFWRRCFADLPKVEPLLEGAEMVLADSYMAMLDEIVAQDVRYAPLYRYQRPRLLTLKEQDAQEASGDISFPLSDSFKAIQFVQATPLTSPINLSSRQGEFTIASGRLVVAEAKLADPRIARYVESVPVGAVITFGSGSTAPRIPAGATLALQFAVGGRTQSLVSVGESRLMGRKVGTAVDVLPVRTGAATLTYGGATYAVTVSAPGTLSYQTWALWAVDSKYDGYALYRTYGHMLGAKRASTEAYRAFVRGVMQLQLLGPALGRLEAGLCAVAGLPVTQTANEKVLSVAPGKIVTSAGIYTFDVAYASRVSPGQIVADAFTSLTDAVVVKDEVSHPGWWHDRIIPRRLLPDVPYLNSRVASTTPYPTNIGPSARWFVGDLNMYVGKKFAHTAAFVLMDEILANNMFTVEVHPLLQADAGLFQSLYALAVQNRPSHTYVLLRPVTEFTETVTLSDPQFGIKQFLPLFDNIAVQGNWAVGDTLNGGTPVPVGYQFELGADGQYGTGDMSMAVGGGLPADPVIPEGFDGAVGDGAVYVRTLSDLEYASPLYAFAQPSGPSVTGGSGPTDLS